MPHENFESCTSHGGMEHCPRCAEAYRLCAEECRKMADGASRRAGREAEARP